MLERGDIVNDRAYILLDESGKLDAVSTCEILTHQRRRTTYG